MDVPSLQQLAPQPFSVPGNIRLYPHEKPLFIALAVVAVAILALATIGTLGMLWLFILWAYGLYLVVGSYLVCYLRGNAVRVTEQQFPDLYARFQACSVIAGVTKLPDFYLLAGDGMLNAFATRFLNRFYVVLLADVVDALEDDGEALNFVIGHELGHISSGHLSRMWWLQVAMFIPLLGPAYARAREYTCDQYGLACSSSVASAVHGLSVFAAGAKRWKSLNRAAFIGQGEQSGGFWMSLHELTADYPWLCKRVSRLESGDLAAFPRRHAMAWIAAALVPRTGLGLFGAALMYSYLLFMALTFGIAYAGTHGLWNVDAWRTADATQPPTLMRVTTAHEHAMQAAAFIDTYARKAGELPKDLGDTGFSVPAGSPIKALALHASDNAVLIVTMAEPDEPVTFYLVREKSDGDHPARWDCVGGPGVKAALLPVGCSESEERPG